MPENSVDVTALAQEMGIPIGINPMKPTDMVIHPGFSRMPPKCPVCYAYLYPTQQDMQSGNQLFTCLNGDIANAGHYMAVWRIGTQTWGQRPGAERDGWVAPDFDKSKTVVKPVLPRGKKAKVIKAFDKKLTKRTPVKHKLVQETMPQNG